MAKVKRVAMVVGVLWVSAMCIAQLPAGTRSADDNSREDAAAAQMRDAESALERGDYKTAEVKLKALAAMDGPPNAQVLYDLGFCEESLGENADAAKSFAASIAANGALAEPRVALGLLEARGGQVEAAHKDLLAAANLQDAAPATRGRALRALATLDEAANPEASRQELLAALKLTPEMPGDALLSAELAERAGDAEDAVTAYKRALAASPGDVMAETGLAHALRLLKKDAEAEQVLTAANTEHPGDPRVVAALAALYADEGKADQAIPMIEQLRASDPKLAAEPSLTRLLARLYVVQGQDAEAAKLFAQLVAAEPGDPTLLDALGSAQVKLAQYAAAEATLGKAAQMRAAFHDDAAWGETCTHLAFAASKNADPKMVLQALAQRATVLPNSGASLFLEATAHDTLHQAQEAIRAYKAFLAVAAGKFPNEEFQARHRLVALEHER